MATSKGSVVAIYILRVVVQSLCDMIQLGRFDRLHDQARNSEKIEGQIFHPVVRKVSLRPLGACLAVEQVYERYHNELADLVELLDYAIKHPDDQRRFSIGIVWKVSDQYWAAFLVGDDSGRELNIGRCRVNEKLSAEYRLLVRRSYFDV
jgi:hypothetical protein